MVRCTFLPLSLLPFLLSPLILPPSTSLHLTLSFPHSLSLSLYNSPSYPPSLSHSLSLSLYNLTLHLTLPPSLIPSHFPSLSHFFSPSLPLPLSTRTKCKKEAWIRCKVRGISLAVEKFGVDRYRKNAEKVQYTLHNIVRSLTSELSSHSRRSLDWSL